MFGETSFKTTVPGEGHLDEDEILLEIDGIDVKINSKTRVSVGKNFGISTQFNWSCSVGQTN